MSPTYSNFLLFLVILATVVLVGCACTRIGHGPGQDLRLHTPTLDLGPSNEELSTRIW